MVILLHGEHCEHGYIDPCIVPVIETALIGDSMSLIVSVHRGISSNCILCNTVFSSELYHEYYLRSNL